MFFSYDQEGFVEVKAAIVEPEGIQLDGDAKCSFSFDGKDIFRDIKTSSCMCVFHRNRFK